ncbi:hypothetical protein OIU77_002299 [Salix suchowensis]|uniref:Uncharacterized protein n=1 Tax=Salix suchowensis TaxID=1278906 RepID=A0ABQ9B6J3_9ROSI|nr:hypothetical protein OIU77_002299 [Salix suchowensis]
MLCKLLECFNCCLDWSSSILITLSGLSIVNHRKYFPAGLTRQIISRGFIRGLGFPLNSMLFFDDEDRNIQSVSKMGVTSILVDNGVNLGALRQGLTEFSQNAS